MDLVKIIAELREERAAIEAALVYLGKLGGSTGKRRGRPPKFLTSVDTAPRQRKPFSEATKKKMALAQKRRWEAERAKQQDSAQQLSA